MSTVRRLQCRSGKGWRRFLADRRGVVAIETILVWPILMIGVLMPLADVSIAGFQYIAAKEALNAFGQSIQYNPPADVTNLNLGNWLSTAQTKAGVDGRFPITNVQVRCGDTNAVCSGANATEKVKSYFFQTSFTLAPLVLSSVLCPGGNCQHTMTHTTRFQ